MFKNRLGVAGVLASALLVLSSTAVLAGFDIEFPEPNARIRVGAGPDVGGNEINTTAVGQTVIGSGAVAEKLTFWITIRNDGSGLDTFKVQRSPGYNNGYRVRYYDALGKDVTGKVNAGTFRTPQLAPTGEYVMRATAKVRSLATNGSSTSRRVTVSSVESPSFQDTVRFIVARAFNSTADLTLSPGDQVEEDDYEYEFSTAEVNGSQTFTVSNGGTGPSRVLLVALSNPGNYQLLNDTCTGTSVAAAGSCSFQIDFIADTDCGSVYLSNVDVMGDELVHLELAAACDF